MVMLEFYLEALRHQKLSCNLNVLVRDAMYACEKK